ncbi:MAG: ribonuclease HII [Peptococcia bacterium]
MFIKEGKMPIKEIRERIKHISQEYWPEIIKKLQLDSRKGVQNIALSMEKRILAAEKEMVRLKQLQKKEKELRKRGYKFIGGIDEAGRGPLAGPVVAACVILPDNCFLSGLNDSKKMSAEQREELEQKIKKEAIAWAVGLVNHKEIDRINILQATKKAMLKAVWALAVKPDYLLLDAMNIDLNIPQENIVHGDCQCAAIAAASIIAKTYRDRIMELMDDFYPVYGFRDNKGYGTARHLEALNLYGPSSVHRKSFLSNYC